jgi:hypothetical protein
MEQKPIFVMLAAVAALVFVGATTGGQTVKASERTCHYWSDGNWQCEPGPFFGYTQHPTIKQVDGTGVCPCGNGKGFWTCANCNDFHQQPVIQQASINCVKNDDGSWTCSPDDYTQHPTVQGVYYDNGGNYYTCPWNGCPDNKAAIIQPQLQEIAYTPTNCFWSYPVQCN